MNIDYEWRENLYKAETPQQLMECVLLLEYYISKNWYSNISNKIFSTLPLPHFAIRCATYSSVALRVFCLDRALQYDKTQRIARGSRYVGDVKITSTGYTGGPVSLKSTLTSSSDVSTKDSSRVSSTSRSRGGNYASTTSNVVAKPPPPPPPPRNSKVSTAAKRGYERTEVIDDVSAMSTRPRRAAMDRARQSLHSAIYDQDNYDSDGQEKVRRNPSQRTASSSSQWEDEAPTQSRSIAPQEWTCIACQALNEPRARSCSVCYERKPPASLIVTNDKKSSKISRGDRMTSRNRSTIKSKNDESEESHDSQSSENDMDDESDGDDKQTSKSNKKRKGKWSENDDDEEDDAYDTNINFETGEVNFEELIRLKDVEYENVSIDTSISEEDKSNTLRNIEMSILMLKLLETVYNDLESVPFWTAVDCKIYTDYRYEYTLHCYRILYNLLL
jgi:hypothetical protein